MESIGDGMGHIGIEGKMDRWFLHKRVSGELIGGVS